MKKDIIESENEFEFFASQITNLHKDAMTLGALNAIRKSHKALIAQRDQVVAFAGLFGRVEAMEKRLADAEDRAASDFDRFAHAADDLQARVEHLESESIGVAMRRN